MLFRSSEQIGDCHSSMPAKTDNGIDVVINGQIQAQTATFMMKMLQKADLI